MIALSATAVTIVAGLLGADLGQIILATSACLLAVTVAGLAAGFKLLPSGRPMWWGAIFAALAMAVVLLFSGFFLALPVAWRWPRRCTRRAAGPGSAAAATVSTALNRRRPGPDRRLTAPPIGPSPSRRWAPAPTGRLSAELD